MKYVKQSLLSLAAVCALTSQLHAQTAASYNFKASSKTFTYLSGGTGASYTGSTDEGVVTPKLGFWFNFCGKEYKEVTACTNGWMSLGTPSQPKGHWYFDNTGAYANDFVSIVPALLPFWDDMDARTGSSSYKVTGSGRNHVFTYEFRNWGYFEGTVDESISMQVKLYETGGIEYLYKQEKNAPAAFTSGSTLGATIGIAASASDYQTLNNETSNATSSAASYTTNIYFRPATDQSFMWFPRNGTNNAGAIELASPGASFCPGTETVKARIMNFGNNRLNSVTVNWEIDGIKQPPVTYTNILDTFGSAAGHEAVVTLGNVPFTGKRTIKVYTSNPNGAADIVTKNDTLVVDITPSPLASITPSGPTIFCTAGALNVTLNAPSSANSTYQWYRDGNIINGAMTPSYNATLAGDYTVKIDSNGCSNTSAPTRVENLAMPLPSVHPSGNVSMCDSVTLVANAGVTGAAYQWYFQGNAITGATNASFTAQSPGNYTVSISKYVCTSNSTGINVSQSAKPAPQITQNAGGTLTTDPSYLTYQWQRDGADIPGATLFAYTPTQPGTYTVKVSNGGCDGISDPIVVGGMNVSTTATSALKVSIYPNPASGMVNIEAPANSNLTLHAADGRVVLEMPTQKNIDISRFSAGIYMLRITDNQGHQLHTEKLIIR